MRKWRIWDDFINPYTSSTETKPIRKILPILARKEISQFDLRLLLPILTNKSCITHSIKFKALQKPRIHSRKSKQLSPLVLTLKSRIQPQTFQWWIGELAANPSCNFKGEWALGKKTMMVAMALRRISSRRRQDKDNKSATRSSRCSTSMLMPISTRLRLIMPMDLLLIIPALTSRAQTDLQIKLQSIEKGLNCIECE